MGMWNRWANANKPADWDETHPYGSGLKDGTSWKIAVHPFYATLLLVRRGLISAAAAGDHFALSSNERAQAGEIIARINSGGSQAEQVERMILLHCVLNMIERGLVTDAATVYGWLGITTPDDR